MGNKIGDENWTQTFFSLKLFGRPRDIPAKSRDIPPKSLVSLGFEGLTELFGPHSFTWKTPTPPEDIRTKKFGFGFFSLPWKKGGIWNGPNETPTNRTGKSSWNSRHCVGSQKSTAEKSTVQKLPKIGSLVGTQSHWITKIASFCKHEQFLALGNRQPYSFGARDKKDKFKVYESGHLHRMENGPKAENGKKCLKKEKGPRTEMGTKWPKIGVFHHFWAHFGQWTPFLLSTTFFLIFGFLARLPLNFWPASQVNLRAISGVANSGECKQKLRCSGPKPRVWNEEIIEWPPWMV